MKRLYLSLLFLFFGATVLMAQNTLLEKYAFAPADYQEVFLDYVANNPSKTINTRNGQYVGQVDKDNMLCGYGMFINNDGSQIIGQFNHGRMLFGIILSGDNARVGSYDYYADYSLSTGHLQFIEQRDKNRVTKGDGLYDYAFVAMKYENGDQFVGEIYQLRRHGYGIYYYANGDIWFGEYNNDVRNGYGVFFDANNNMTIGRWEGEDPRRIIHVKEK